MAAQATWTSTAPSGVYKSHAMSMQLREAAVEDSIFMEHVTPEPGYAKGRGDTLTITRVSAVSEPTSATLSETDRIPEDQYQLNTTSITVKELGRSVPFTSLLEDLSEFDITNSVQKELRKQLKLVLDTKIATAFKGCQLKYTPTGLTSATTATGGTAGAAATENMNVYHLEEIRDLLYDTYYVPPAEGDDYIGIFRTLSLRGIKRDPAWEEWHKYTDPSAKFNNEVGRIEQIRLKETNHNNSLGKVGTSSVLGEGVVFGDDAVVMAEALTPELRVAFADFDRSQAIAWYGILEFGEPMPTSNAGEAKIMHVAST
jgi:N4-gp56 family major capsid protein